MMASRQNLKLTDDQKQELIETFKSVSEPRRHTSTITQETGGSISCFFSVSLSAASLPLSSQILAQPCSTPHRNHGCFMCLVTKCTRVTLLPSLLILTCQPLDILTCYCLVVFLSPAIFAPRLMRIMFTPLTSRK